MKGDDSVKVSKEHLEYMLPFYLEEVRPHSFSWGNKEDVAKLVRWVVEKNR
ncbi:hypothetical protein PQE75_gp027 [Bacillus phage vB_BcoS-136]|uniref:Uncharacterized protein n=1 Tax=Bacillus phage vB_BcoS-136 TaxID=2419619 RepID=A0A3G3BV90_9CAUD|nr:hypothetical protein PQE75_gp027 [Bacillus phage vB_BcoS-136]AYP68159.1 hypothetical protein vBBcoS136_00027 [Bacillus phage vB_BcoS-136]